MGKRRRARELALQYLYQWDFHGEKGKEVADLFWQSRSDGEEVKSFAESLIHGVEKNRESIDQRIESRSSHWKLYRMSRVDRNILRLAAYELEFLKDIPPKVTIDEAIEIAKRFGTTESASFINGILDQVAKSLQQDPASEQIPKP
ncbi:MAG: transcription antitermination factor NusB [bacterium]